MSFEVEKYIDRYNRVNADNAETYCVYIIFSNNGEVRTECFNSKKEAAAFFAGLKYGQIYSPVISYAIPGTVYVDDLGGRE